MTLQQKLLAKQSKKGFTLVELVVVIAILGILAAIAIPAVIGIINSANESQAKSDAASIDAACKNLYAEVVAGTITSDNPGKVSTNKANLTKATDTATKKKSAAQACTVQMALEYAGLTGLQGKVGTATAGATASNGDFVFEVKTGTIYAALEHSANNTDYKSLSTTTKFDSTGLNYK